MSHSCQYQRPEAGLSGNLGKFIKGNHSEHPAEPKGRITSLFFRGTPQPAGAGQPGTSDCSPLSSISGTKFRLLACPWSLEKSWELNSAKIFVKSGPLTLIKCGNLNYNVAIKTKFSQEANYELMPLLFYR